MNKWKPVDFVIGVFAITVSVVLLTTVGSIMLTEGSLTEESGKRMTVVVTSMVSIVSMYVGAKIQENRDK